MDISSLKITKGKGRGVNNPFIALTFEIMKEFDIPETDTDTKEAILHGAVLKRNGVGLDLARYAMNEAKYKGIGYFWAIIRRIKKENRK